VKGDLHNNLLNAEEDNFGITDRVRNLQMLGVLFDSSDVKEYQFYQILYLFFWKFP
jgi:hypothetical protein